MPLATVTTRIQNALRGNGTLPHRGEEALRQPPAVTIRQIDGEPNASWNKSRRGTLISVVRKPVVRRDSQVFAIGSCFAMEIRNVLRQKGFAVFPQYHAIAFDPQRQRIGKLPHIDNINHYDTFTIRQEFEQAFGTQPPSRRDDFWKVDASASKVGAFANGALYQDPYRKHIFADSLESLETLTRRLDACIHDAIRSVDVYIITLGLIEVWRDRRSGRYVCRAPSSSQMDDVEFVLSDFAGNLDNMRRVCSLIAAHRPGAQIVLTVSPVALGRTFTGRDVVVANMESKSLLRAVAGQIDREFDNVTYWPSYEIAMREDVFKDDGRHVTTQAVEKILDAFIETHCEQ
jgi:hypothetical protein